MLLRTPKKRSDWVPRLLVVDLLAEREAFGKYGTAEIVRHFPEHEIFLWSPHTSERKEYGFGTVVDSPVPADVIFITGSRRNVSEWEEWMDDVADLIRTCDVPLYGICFGHQIIVAALGGEVARAEESSQLIAPVTYEDGTVVNQLFTHQDYVINSGEMEIIASAEHCVIAACQHPTRLIKTVQYHPEVVLSVIDYSLQCGDMNKEEREEFGNGIQDFDVTQSLIS